MKRAALIATFAATVAIPASGAAASQTLYHALLTTKIPPSELPAGARLLAVGPMSSVDIAILTNEINGYYDIESAVIMATTAGQVVLFVTGSPSYASSLAWEVLAVSVVKGNTSTCISSGIQCSAWAFANGQGWADDGPVAVYAHALNGDPGTAATLVDFGLRHYRDAEAALKS